MAGGGYSVEGCLEDEEEEGQNKRGSQVLRLRVRRNYCWDEKIAWRENSRLAMFRGMPCHDRMGRGTTDTTHGLRWARVVRKDRV